MKDLICLKEFAKYSSLNVLGMIGLSCYILGDTYFISKGIGAEGLAALNLAIPIYSFVNGCGLMLGMGGATKYSIFQSQKEALSANRVFTNTVMLALGFASAFFIIGAIFSGIIAEILGADGAVFQMSKTYLQVILLFAPMFILNDVLLCFVRNDGAPHLSMMAMVGGSLSNIVLDYVFIFPCKMGIFGAVFATGLAPVISLLILSPFIFKRHNRFHFIKCRLLKRLAKDIFSSGLPSLVTEASSGIVIIIFNLIILRLEGNIGVAAYGVIANLSLVMLSIYTGIAQGIQPIISKNYGMGNGRNARAILRYAFITVLLISIIAYSGIFLKAAAIAGIFNSENNMRLEEIAITGLKIYFTGCVFAGFNLVLSVFFTSTEHPLPAHIISMLRGFLIIIPMAFVLSSIGGLIGVWCVFPVTELAVSVIGAMYQVKSNIPMLPF